ncbi:hypothetical protein DL546_004135 [Coniochaeta pulveracea]|uniref:Major facilitator superfamily (MFS) profile domain-containing protein n=1 Tax=Coniochaeta pulveracea TaxID=177199 RepID=A0A420Y627_9PEZI|nr:hypothetical protein DL546_004135 [Coniochaeta pulveracea]
MAYEKATSIPDVDLENASNPELKEEGQAPPPDESNVEVEAPEGGTKAWLSLLGAFCAMFVSFGWVNCIALFQTEYESNELKQYSKSAVSWITSLEAFFMLFASPVAGWMFDNYGPRLPVFIGTILHVLGLMMASLSKEFYQFALSQSVCSGIGTSFIFTPSMTAPMTYFEKRRAIAGGLTTTGSALGGVIFPFIAIHLIPKAGFPWAMRACAFLILFLLIITNLTISSNLEHRKKPFKISNFVHPMRELNFVIISLASFCLYWAMFIPFDYIASAAIRYGMSSTNAFNLIPILNGASFFGRTVPNLLADKYGRFNVMVTMVLFNLIIVLAIWLPGRSDATSIVYAVLFGFGSGGCIGLAPVLIMQISPINEVGYRMGTIFAVSAVASLTSPPIGGAIVEATNGGVYDYAAVFSGVNFALALCLCAWLRARVVGRKIAIKG